MKKKTIKKKKILEFTFDPTAKAIYIMFKDEQVARTERQGDNIFIDFDAKGDLIGVECIRTERGRAEISMRKQLDNISRRYHIPELKRVHPEKLDKIYA